MKFGIGQSAPRKEDRRLVTGTGRFVDDLAPSGALHAVVLRSPTAHARIKSIDTSSAAAMPGVAAVLTGEDYEADGLGGLTGHTFFPGVHADVVNPPFPAIAVGRVLYVGAAVALIVAETRERALEAAEAVTVDYEELPALVSVEQAMAEGAPVLWEDAKQNVAFVVAMGDAEAADKAIAGAAHVTKLTLRNNRVSANPMEMRGAVARFDAFDGRLTYHTSTQQPHAVREYLGAATKLPETAIRVIATDVGGGFGMKGGIHPEDVLTAWAAIRLRGTVRWTPQRSESLQADYHGRDQTVTAQLALDGEGRMLGLKVDSIYNNGAFNSPAGGVPPLFATTLAAGVYRIPAVHARARSVFTNTSPTQPYRGAGRPEAAFLIERLMDKAAGEIGMDRVAFRRLNMVGPADMPYRTGLAYTFDCGDFPGLLDAALEAANWDGFAARRERSAASGMLRGMGIAVHVENAGLVNEHAAIRFDPGGGLTVIAGTFSHGQGHETAYAQMVSDWLGVPFDEIRFVQGDTDAVEFGRGTVASRSMINGGSSLRLAADEIIEKGRRIAGQLMEAAAEDVAFENGAYTVAGTDKSMPIAQVARMSFLPILPPELGLGLSGSGAFLLKGFSFPNGCQVAEVEIDPETGATTLLSLISVDDVGAVVNPLLLDGQLVGGIAQGVGQALLEDVVYAPDTGQLVTASFLDYAMPRADDLPAIDVSLRNVPTESNPLGVKGAGEAGTVGAMPVVVSAVLDALKARGVTDIATPATPERVWRALRGGTPQHG